MTLDQVVSLALALFFLICPHRKRNRVVEMLYRGVRIPLARLGLNHTAWTMFHAGTNRNHFLVLRLRSTNGTETLEVRDPWKRGRLWGDLIDERLRRIVLTVIRSDTGPITKRTLGQRLVRWCVRHRVDLPSDTFEGEAVYGQEVFYPPPLQDDQDKFLVVVKYVLRFTVAGDGQLSFSN